MLEKGFPSGGTGATDEIMTTVENTCFGLLKFFSESFELSLELHVLHLLLPIQDLSITHIEISTIKTVRKR